MGWSLRRVLCARRPEFSTVDEFKEIIAAVSREYGDKLILSAGTVYVDIPSALIAALRESAA